MRKTVLTFDGQHIFLTCTCTDSVPRANKKTALANAALYRYQVFKEMENDEPTFGGVSSG